MAEKPFRVLAVNPGSTSTKIAVYDDTQLVAAINLTHTAEDLAPFKHTADEYGFRRDAILRALEEKGIDLASLDAVSGRGGGLEPVPSGTFRVNEAMVADARRPKNRHAALLGPMIAYELAQQLHIPAFMVDPVNVDELDDVTRVTGVAGFVRPAGSHALNIKATVRKAAKQLSRDYADCNFIIAHVGGGISVAAHRRGRMVEVEGALFTPERSAPKPNILMELVFGGKHTKEEIQKMMMGAGGLYSYFGTKDVREVEKMIDAGNAEAALVFHAMAYNVAKSVGACYSVLKGDVDALAITGGVAHSQRFVNYIKDYCRYIGTILVFPGENELESLAMGALRVLKGEEKARQYPAGALEA